MRLSVNETKSAVAKVFGRKFLGYAFWAAAGGAIKRRVADKAMAALKNRIRQLTGRSGGRGMTEVVERLRSDVPGYRANPCRPCGRHCRQRAAAVAAGCDPGDSHSAPPTKLARHLHI